MGSCQECTDTYLFFETFEDTAVVFLFQFVFFLNKKIRICFTTLNALNVHNSNDAKQ